MCSAEENYLDEKKSSVKSNSNDNLLVSIKGRIKNHGDYWEENLGGKSVVRL